MRVLSILEFHRRAQKYRALFLRAMKLARQYRAERDEMANTLRVLKMAIAKQVELSQSELAAARERAEQAQAKLERAQQEERDSARTAGQLIRLVRDNGWMTEEEIAALPDEAPRLAAVAGRPRRFRKDAEVFAPWEDEEPATAGGPEDEDE